MPLPYCLWAVFAVAGCIQGHSAHLPVTVVGDGAGNQTVHVKQGTHVDVVLRSSYWKFDGSSAPTVLREDGPARLLPLPPGVSCPPGTGCRPVEAVFTAGQPGTAVVKASRTVCGEAMLCAPGQRSYQLAVVVTK